LAGFFIYN